MTDKLNAERRQLAAILEGMSDADLQHSHYNEAQIHNSASRAILAMAEENARMRKALERCRAIVQQHNHRQNEKVEDAVHIVNSALGKDRANG